MTASFNVDPVSRITAGAVGEPGQRTFFLQAVGPGTAVSLLMEKGQVSALARHIEALLERLEATHPVADEGPEPEPRDLELQGPIEPEFRVGDMSLGYDAERDLILLQCNEVTAPPDSDEPDEEAEEGSTARFWATRGQMRALARQGAGAVSSGRPVCELCGGPIDPGGHACTALNGHKQGRNFS